VIHASAPRVLVVDEDLNALSALAELLRNDGYEVAIAATDLEATSALNAFQPEVILTEVRFPGIWPGDVGAMGCDTAGTAQRVLMSVADVPRELMVPWIKKPIVLASLLALLSELTGGPR
jgi:CheY-like chemotaxis protein